MNDFNQNNCKTKPFLKYIFGVVLVSFALMSCSGLSQDQVEAKSGSKPSKDGWKLKFSNDPNTPWQNNWFLDGRIGKVTNTSKGLKIEAGPEAKNDAHHLVLWTKQEFAGDIKIEYDFTKIDDEHKMVNILYIQATGIGDANQDILSWAEERQIPSMRSYFNRMKLLHISYAAYGQTNENPNEDYVRARAYPVHSELGFKGMEVPPSYYNTGLFKKDVVYKIEVEKTLDLLSFSVRPKDQDRSKTKVFTWAIPKRGQVDFGRVGLRHMYTRQAIYNNFKVYTR
ncbi:DUF1961 family protein [Paraglaciecola aquimarina]|uniref:DUF1961 family protein n=1 Tax=Paraglaciecola algarum TaxID=3050085 RepID=A0ABS9D7M3_9ALTE|nr:DUF1961 family protein [Paraglaciecola sp. G1-23]MCF2948876.1 DUF1961 family protein [Paraglaciecola sp. G1-23]